MIAPLRVVKPRNDFRSVPVRPPDSGLRTREYLTPAEVEKLIKVAKDGRWGHRSRYALGDMIRSPVWRILLRNSAKMDLVPCEPDNPPKSRGRSTNATSLAGDCSRVLHLVRQCREDGQRNDQAVDRGRRKAVSGKDSCAAGRDGY